MTRHFYILLLALALCVPVRAARQTLLGVSDGGGSNPFASLPAPSAYYRMETGGFTTPDSVGSLDLSSTGSFIGTVAGIIGNGLNIGGAANSLLTRADANDALRVTGNFTWAGWIKFAGPTFSNDFLPIACKWNGTGGSTKNSWGVFVHDTAGTTDRFSFNVTSNGSTSNHVEDNNFGQIPTGTWAFVCARWDGSNIKLSTNAGTVTSAAQAAVFGGTGAAGTVAAYGGGQYGDAIGSKLDAPQDEMGWWQGTALTDAQVTTLYHGGAGLTFYSGAWHTS